MTTATVAATATAAGSTTAQIVGALVFLRTRLAIADGACRDAPTRTVAYGSCW